MSELAAALGALAEVAHSKAQVNNERWIRIAANDVHTLATIRAEYARYLTHHDTYELARAVGQVISEPVDVLPEDQRVVVRHPNDDESSSDA